MSLSRRQFLKTSGVAASSLWLSRMLPFPAHALGGAEGFTPLPHSRTDVLAIAEGFKAQVFLRWGDALFSGLEGFSPKTNTGETQLKRFGYNCDFTAFFPFEGSSDHGMLCVNHEYPNRAFMHDPEFDVKERVRVQMAAVGMSLVEVKRTATGWQPVMNSSYTRRIHANTPMRISGPAAGHERMKTSQDPDGLRVLGTFENCSGGVTPWRTVLTCEENIQHHFEGSEAGREQENHQRMGMSKRANFFYWAMLDERFSIAKEPHEPNRFGWVVEINPYDPHATPIKHTALGRIKHEGACCVVNGDGRLVVYMGDDENGEHLYRYVSTGRYVVGQSTAELLTEGTLYAASFTEDGMMRWLPLVQGQGPLTEEAGFKHQADVLIETRRAASLLGATPMDRPEGIAVQPGTQMVFVSLTKNPMPKVPNPANPQAINLTGHILSMQPPEGDHTAEMFGWNIYYNPTLPIAAKDVPQLACPDNLTFGPKGTLWVATDGMETPANANDGLFALRQQGGDVVADRLLSAPHGSEVTGPSFTPDGTTLFVSIQHPGEGSDPKNPSTRWPDFDPDMPPRPSVLAITREDGGVIS